MYKNCRVTPIKHILIQKNLYRDEAEKIQKMRYLWYNLYVLLLEPKGSSPQIYTVRVSVTSQKEYFFP